MPWFQWLMGTNYFTKCTTIYINENSMNGSKIFPIQTKNASEHVARDTRSVQLRVAMWIRYILGYKTQWTYLQKTLASSSAKIWYSKPPGTQWINYEDKKILEQSLCMDNTISNSSSQPNLSLICLRALKGIGWYLLMGKKPYS